MASEEPLQRVPCEGDIITLSTNFLVKLNDDATFLNNIREAIMQPKIEYEYTSFGCFLSSFCLGLPSTVIEWFYNVHLHEFYAYWCSFMLVMAWVAGTTFLLDYYAFSIPFLLATLFTFVCEIIVLDSRLLYKTMTSFSGLFVMANLSAHLISTVTGLIQKPEYTTEVYVGIGVNCTLAACWGFFVIHLDACHHYSIRVKAFIMLNAILFAARLYVYDRLATTPWLRTDSIFSAFGVISSSTSYHDIMVTSLLNMLMFWSRGLFLLVNGGQFALVDLSVRFTGQYFDPTLNASLGTLEAAPQELVPTDISVPVSSLSSSSLSSSSLSSSSSSSSRERESLGIVELINKKTNDPSGSSDDGESDAGALIHDGSDTWAVQLLLKDWLRYVDFGYLQGKERVAVRAKSILQQQAMSAVAKHQRVLNHPCLVWFSRYNAPILIVAFFILAVMAYAPGIESLKYNLAFVLCAVLLLQPVVVVGCLAEFTQLDWNLLKRQFLMFDFFFTLLNFFIYVVLKVVIFHAVWTDPSISPADKRSRNMIADESSFLYSLVQRQFPYLTLQGLMFMMDNSIRKFPYRKLFFFLACLNTSVIVYTEFSEAADPTLFVNVPMRWFIFTTTARDLTCQAALNTCIFMWKMLFVSLFKEGEHVFVRAALRIQSIEAMTAEKKEQLDRRMELVE